MRRGSVNVRSDEEEEERENEELWRKRQYKYDTRTVMLYTVCTENSHLLAISSEI